MMHLTKRRKTSTKHLPDTFQAETAGESLRIRSRSGIAGAGRRRRLCSRFGTDGEGRRPHSQAGFAGEKRVLRSRLGATLVEMLVTLALISIMLAMAAAALASAARVFVKVQRTQYAQSILDTTMTELRGIARGACGYVKIYDTSAVDNSGEVSDKAPGSDSGTVLEFVNEDGYAVLLSADGCAETTIYIGDSANGTVDAVDSGRLLTRYYFRDNEGYYTNVQSGSPAARAVATVFGEGFYMKNYLKVTYTFPDGVSDGNEVTAVTATITLYSDSACTDAVATDTTTLEFEHRLVRKDAATATHAE